MAIITKPETIVKNQNNSFTLIKDDILDLTLNDVSIFTGSKFADSTTWKTVRLKYRSLTTKEYEVVEFNAQQVSPSGIFFVSEDADNDFKVVNITIANFDNATFVINRDLLDSCEINNVPVNVESIFDVTFDAPTVGTPIVWDLFLNGAIPEADGGLVGGTEPPFMKKSSASKIENGADFKITYNFLYGYGLLSDVVHAVMPSIADTGYIGMTGITYQSSSEILIYDNYSGGGYQASFSNSMMVLDGTSENSAVFEKVGNVLTIKMNGVLIYTKNNYTDQTTVPSVRTFGTAVLTSSYVE
jgi:hypothetical protein